MEKESFVKAGEMEYKIDHGEKRVFKKQALAATASPVERKLHPEGFIWLDTNGDYKEFVRTHPDAKVLGVVAEAKEPPKVLSEPKHDAMVDREADEPFDIASPSELLGTKRLKSR